MLKLISYFKSITIKPFMIQCSHPHFWPLLDFFQFAKTKPILQKLLCQDRHLDVLIFFFISLFPVVFLLLCSPFLPLSPIPVSVAGGKMVMPVMTRLLCTEGLQVVDLQRSDQKYSAQNVVSEKPSILHHAIFTICLHNKFILEETGCLYICLAADDAIAIYIYCL